MASTRTELSPTRLVRALLEVQHFARAGLSVEESMPLLCESVLGLLECDRVGVMLLNDDRDVYELACEAGDGVTIAASVKEFGVERSHPVIRRLEQNPLILILNEAQEDPDMGEIAKAVGIKSLAVALMVADDGSAVGVMSADYSENVGQFGELESVVLLGAAGLLESAIIAERVSNERDRLVAEASMAREAERRRLGRELHDTALQEAFAICLLLESLQHNGTLLEPGELSVILAKCRSMADGLRILTNEMHPESTAADGLEAVLHQQLTRSEPGGDWRVSLTNTTTTPPGAEAAMSLSRIATQAMSNIRRHAEASEVRIELSTVDNGTQLVITDNGRGFDTEQRSPGHLGLISMKERAQINGGTCLVSSTEGEGTTLRAWLPHATDES